MTTSDREVVAALGEAIARRIGEPRYHFWFEHNTKLSWGDERLVVGVPNHFYQEWLEKTFADDVRAAAAEVLGRPLEIRFHIDPELFQAARRAQDACQGGEVDGCGKTSAATDPPTRNAAAKIARLNAVPAAAAAALPSPGHKQAKRNRSWHRLHDFVVGSCNRMAHASALSVVETPGAVANPLVLHGPVGTGKTHLLEGIYAGLRKSRPDWRVCFVTSEDFTNCFVQAMRQGKLGAFRKRFRDCDALLMDDVQFLGSKPATQEEFLHTFDALLADGRQLVLTAHGHPKLMAEFNPLLTDRFVGGSVWGLTTPDADTRLQIVRLKAARTEPPVSEEVLRFLADQLRGNVRELEGALNAVRHYARVAARPIDLGLAREALGDLLRHAVCVVQLADVGRAVCTALRLAAGALQAKERTRAVSHPRMLAMYLARQRTSAAYSEIGSFFGGRNHSTALAAEKKVRAWLRDDGVLQLGEQRFRVREVLEAIERDLLG